MKIPRLPVAAVVMALLVTGSSAVGAFTLARGFATPLFEDGPTGPMLTLNTYYDELMVTDAFIASGDLKHNVNTYVGRAQYDMINTVALDIQSFTVSYDKSVASKILGAGTPTGYISRWGENTYLGGQDYLTMFTTGFGTYAFNNGAPWSIDYQEDHITFTGPGVAVRALPGGAVVGATNEAGTVPSFSVIFDRCVAIGPRAREAWTLEGDGSHRMLTSLNWNPPSDVAEPSGALVVLPGLMLWLRRRKH